MSEDVYEFLGLSHEGAYTSRCQMPKFEQRILMDFVFKKGDGLIQIHLDLWNKTRMSMFVMEGMLEGE